MLHAYSDLTAADRQFDAHHGDLPVENLCLLAPFEQCEPDGWVLIPRKSFWGIAYDKLRRCVKSLEVMILSWAGWLDGWAGQSMPETLRRLFERRR